MTPRQKGDERGQLWDRPSHLQATAESSGLPELGRRSLLRAWQPEFSGQRRGKGCTEQRPGTCRELPLEDSAGDRGAHGQEEATEAGTGPLGGSSWDSGRCSHRARNHLRPHSQSAGPSNTQGTQEDSQKDTTYLVG